MTYNRPRDAFDCMNVIRARILGGLMCQAGLKPGITSVMSEVNYIMPLFPPHYKP